MVERANNISLGEYMQANLWTPLGIKNIGFRLDDRPDMIQKTPHMSERQGGKNHFTTALIPSMPVGHTDNTVWSPTGVDGSGGAGGLWRWC